MKVSMIVAYGNDWEIGLDNSLLWHISEDLKNFKRLTNHHHIIMGRKTFESIGKPLPNRTSVVISRKGFECDGVHTFSDAEKAIEFCKDNGEEEVFIIGGAQIYDLMFPLVDRLYLTKVDFNGKADAFLKPIDFSSWVLVEETKYDAIIVDEKVKSLPWTFGIYDLNTVS